MLYIISAICLLCGNALSPEAENHELRQKNQALLRALERMTVQEKSGNSEELSVGVVPKWWFEEPEAQSDAGLKKYDFCYSSGNSVESRDQSCPEGTICSRSGFDSRTSGGCSAPGVPGPPYDSHCCSPTAEFQFPENCYE